jgi:uncharacterized membrane protein
VAENVFVYVGVYESRADAEADYDALKALHSAGVVGTYDAAVITKDDEGKVHVSKHEKPTQHGAWSGLVVGGLIGLFFPPAWIVGGAAIGAAAGGLVGHLWGGLSRSDLKDLGEALDEGEASLLIVGEDKLDEALERELKRAKKKVEKQIKADQKAFEKELEESIKQSA